MFGSLPSAATSQGARAMITDANLVATGNFAAQVFGNGDYSNTVPVFSDGTDWRIG